MQIGTKVQINWESGITGHKDIELIYPLGHTVCEVVYYDGVGINHVLLPKGVTLPGFSKPWGDEGHFIVLHDHHIKPAAISKCARCGESNGRHKGGCALAPEMYKTPEGIPVRRTPRKYHGDFDG